MRDQVIVVTGASGGIGAALAERVSRAGGLPVLAARRERELEAARARCGERAIAVVTDVTRRADVQRLLDRALERHGHVDVWVNNAGRGISRPVSQLSVEEFDEMIDVNLRSALHGMQVALAHFKARRRGHIINVSSMLGRVPYVPWRSAYSAAKHALNALTASLRLELRGEFPDIHVSTVSPGVVATEFGVHALGGGPDSRTLPGAQPLDEVADVIAALIERPRADVYTQPGSRQHVVDYFAAEDMGEAESRPPFLPPRPAAPAAR
jgi:NAD(P)-dependent dehydrogenase (short-subunit alcohol dehydrogenase family)